MKIVIFGATGTIGRVLVAQALSEGHAVTAFTRSGKFEGDQHANLSIVQGDVLDGKAVSAAIKGQEAVICTLGAGRNGVVRSKGTENILNGMKDHGVNRFICQSTLGAGDSAGNLNFFWKNIMFGMLLRPAMADHNLQENSVRKSDVDWTIVRPAAFTDGPVTGNYQHGFPGNSPKGLALKISRADVAHFLLKQLKSDAYLNQAASLSY
ncbi:MAG: SDR family oxidoreductase [Rhizobiaceae bacterium]|nr:SDR family oxidoreductase [Rhizobiaceae bacterium]